MTSRYKATLFVGILVLGLIRSTAAATPYHGDFKFGYIHTDDDGNRSVTQPTFNLYEGAVLSLENFSWKFDNGARITANLRNVTLDNRNLTVQLSHPGRYAISLRHYQYRRVYSFDGGDFTKRRLSSVEAWMQPLKQIRLFGSFGYETKQGNGIEFYEPSGLRNPISYDYDRRHFLAGVRLSQARAAIQAEYRASISNAESASLTARDANRYKVSASSPMPKLERITLHGGFQHYEWRNSDTETKLSSNTVWGGGRFAATKELTLKYSFTFDRARYDADPIATDNISHSLTADRVWPSKAGLSVGFRYKTNDDLSTEKTSDSYLASGWLQVVANIKIAAGYGSEREDFQEGGTLTGAGNFTKFYGSVKYTHPGRQVILKIESRSSTNDEIESSADIVRASSDIQFGQERFGEVLVSYSYLRGNYENSETSFELDDHVLTAEVSSVYVGRIQGTARGTYYRSERDLDVESFSAGVTGRYRLASNLVLEAGYSSYVYDDLLLTTATYTRFYTANVIVVKLTRSF